LRQPCGDGRLADARLAGDDEEAWRVGVDEPALDLPEDPLAADEILCALVDVR
jgi:hypothetical protein